MKFFAALPLLLLFQGCVAISYLTVATGTPGQPVSGGNVPAVLTLAGTIRLGLAAGATGGSSPGAGVLMQAPQLSAGMPLSTAAPLASGAPLSIGATLAPVQLTSGAALTMGSPLVSNNAAGLVSTNVGGLVSNNAAGLGSNAGLSYRLWGLGMAVQDVAGDQSRVFVELVDPSSGTLWSRVLADAQGHFTLALPTTQTRRAFFVQSTMFKGQAIVGFLAAPVGVGVGESGSRPVMLSPGSTTTAFAQALLVGVRQELTIDKGFRGFSTRSLAQVVADSDGSAMNSAINAVDGLGGTDGFNSMDQVLTRAATSAFSFAKAAASLSTQADPVLDAVVAAQNLILRQLPTAAAASKTLDETIAKAAAGIQTSALAAELERLRALPVNPAFEASVPVPSATPGSSVTPASSATPGSSAFKAVVTTVAGGGGGMGGGKDGAVGVSSFWEPSGMLFDPTKKLLYIVETGTKLLRSYSPITMQSSTVRNLTSSMPNASPFGIAFSGDKNSLYVTNTQGNIYSINLGGGGVGTERNIAGSPTGGSGFAEGNSGDGGSARFSQPTAIVFDPDPRENSLYVADTGNNRIRYIFLNSSDLGLTGTVVGDGTGGFLDNSAALSAQINGPRGLALDPGKALYIADTGNNRIRKYSLDDSMALTTFAGSGVAGAADGQGTAAQFNHPNGLALDQNGNLFVADRDNQLIRVISPTGRVSTLAGSGAAGAVDGTGAAARFNNPTGIAYDGAANLYVSDQGSNTIRKLALQ